MNSASGPFELPQFPEGYSLKTSRLSLRAPCAEDVDVLWPHMIDSRLTPFLAWEPHQSLDETRSLIAALIEAQILGKAFHWVVRHGEVVVGLISLIDVRRMHRTWTLNRAELAIWITSAGKGQGFATEGGQAVMHFAFGPLRLHKLLAYHALDNLQPARIVEKLGFRLVGDELEAFSKHGRWHDLRHYEMLLSEFESLHSSKP
jgi:[ribosomal protein S5]-alanine N-acetyltransferase